MLVEKADRLAAETIYFQMRANLAGWRGRTGQTTPEQVVFETLDAGRKFLEACTEIIGDVPSTTYIDSPER